MWYAVYIYVMLPIEVKLRAVEGFDLDGSPPIGEVLVRGPNVCIKRLVHVLMTYDY